MAISVQSAAVAPPFGIPPAVTKTRQPSWLFFHPHLACPTAFLGVVTSRRDGLCIQWSDLHQNDSETSFNFTVCSYQLAAGNVRKSPQPEDYCAIMRQPMRPKIATECADRGNDVCNGVTN
jgi:hypothetical protein